MKKILLLAVAAMLAVGANAQLVARSSAARATVNQKISVEKPSMVKQSMDMRTPGAPVVKKAPKKAPDMEPYYRRPAGAFAGSFVFDQGEYIGGYSMPFMVMKPFCEYTYQPYYDGNASDIRFWDYFLFGYDEETGERASLLYMTPEDEDLPELSVTYGWEYDDVPVLYVNTPNNSYQMGADGVASQVLACDNMLQMLGYDDLMLSSKTMTSHGRNGDTEYMFTYYSGAQALDGTDSGDGYWFGKNGSLSTASCTYALNGIAQAFEKPTHPYMLKQVLLYTTELTVTAPVEMTCKVYKLDEIQDYMEEDEVILPEEPGELIAYGKATVTPETDEVAGGVVAFTLYGEEDGLEYEVTPTIEDAIMICIDGYNDPGMENLANFSALISSDDAVDEGYGELAYMKFASKNSEGGVDQYVWRGLNNFFTSGQMMTGLSIFITTENPFMTFNYTAEDGEYTFPVEGGVMEKNFGIDETGAPVKTRSIEFFSSVPSVDDGWYLSCNGDDVPEWLNIELEDGEEEGEFSGLVNALVTAEALPAGVNYREAVVRFEIPGAYIDYKFMQGDKPAGLVGDVNGDGEVNIADVNAVIDMILSGTFDAVGDVNGDGEVNIADVNAVIDIILK